MFVVTNESGCKPSLSIVADVMRDGIERLDAFSAEDIDRDKVRSSQRFLQSLAGRLAPYLESDLTNCRPFFPIMRIGGFPNAASDLASLSGLIQYCAQLDDVQGTAGTNLLPPLHHTFRSALETREASAHER